jgi:hypothetical protein
MKRLEATKTDREEAVRELREAIRIFSRSRE